MLSRLPQNPPLSGASQRQGERQLPHLRVRPGLDKAPVCLYPRILQGDSRGPVPPSQPPPLRFREHWVLRTGLLPSMGPDGPVPYVGTSAPSLCCPPGSDSAPPQLTLKSTCELFF